MQTHLEHHIGAAASSRDIGGYSVRAVDSSNFSTRRACAVRHNFHHHELMQLPRLAKLAQELRPSRQCRFAPAGMTQTSAFVHTPKSPDGLSIEDVFARIEEPGSWVALYNVQTDPHYAAFLQEVMASVTPLIAAQQPGVFHITGFIFISAPPAVTLFHIDRENNFWLQIRGRKTMTVFDHSDRSLVPAHAVEEFIVHGSLKNVRLDPAMRGHGCNFDVGPGDGVYFPSTTPHMTETPLGWELPGDGVSISIGVNFYTAVTRRHAQVHQFNRVLRKLGLDPVFPGIHGWRDRLKAPFGRAVAASRARWFDYIAPPGAY